MKLIAILASAALASTVAFGALAQTAAPPSPEKMALAREMLEATGGAKQMDAVLKSVFQNMGATIGANLPPEQKRMQQVILQKFQERMSAMLPKMIDASVEVYADNLSEKELRDYVAWMHSESGQAIIAKMPQIAAASLKTMMPMITDMTQGLKKDVIDQVCVETKCTAQDRQTLAEAMDKAMPKRPS